MYYLSFIDLSIAIIYRAMEVLDLLLTYQSNTRLEAFVRKFKQCETSADLKSKNQNILLPAIYSNYNAFETKK
jgi:inositol 1,4,5-triphosphate receptor type 1